MKTFHLNEDSFKYYLTIPIMEDNGKGKNLPSKTNKEFYNLSYQKVLMRQYSTRKILLQMLKNYMEVLVCLQFYFDIKKTIKNQALLKYIQIQLSKYILVLIRANLIQI